ncbi:MAG TPA: YciI family protein [Opitutaceae bacterium]|nr:YciI family protein [Opitutaceae bacterium]
MKYYFYKLIPPRPDFPQTMTPAELAIMQSHVGYWAGHMQQGRVVVFGPVADPAGAFGMAVVQLPDEAAPEPLRDNDPAITAGIGFRGEIHPMLRASVAGQAR